MVLSLMSNMKNIKSYNTFKLNESVSPYGLDYGFYNMCNVNEDLFDKLSEFETEIEIKYDQFRNYLIIKTDNPKPISKMLIDNAAYKMNSDESSNAMNDPNDCILLKVKSSPNPPPGAFM